MSISSIHDPAGEALLGAARDHSPAEERKCHVLLDLLDTCHAVGQVLSRELARKDLTETGFRILALVVRGEPGIITPLDVTAALGLPPPAVSTTLGRLEISGLITRARTGPDRRAVAIRITSAGRRAFAAALAHYRKMVAHVMSGLEADEIASLDRACTQLRQLSTPTR